MFIFSRGERLTLLVLNIIICISISTRAVLIDSGQYRLLYRSSKTSSIASAAPVRPEDEGNDVALSDDSEHETIQFPINLNEATANELMRLPGVGPVIAGRIEQYRAQNGPFRHVDDVKNVKGIGRARFEQIRELIFVPTEPDDDESPSKGVGVNGDVEAKETRDEG